MKPKYLQSRLKPSHITVCFRNNIYFRDVLNAKQCIKRAHYRIGHPLSWAGSIFANEPTPSSAVSISPIHCNCDICGVPKIKTLNSLTLY